VKKDPDALRERLQALLADGLPTQWRQRAYTNEQVNSVVSRLQALAPDDYPAKLDVAGFTLDAYRSADIELAQDCSTCMYYARAMRFCALPELRLPVQPQWSCRLWRI
jgi:hypothetical protein